jgi:nucleoside-diphosphate-sugar epimerase
MIAEKMNWSGTINWDTKPKRPGEIYWLNSNGKLLKETTGWEPKVSLSDGLDRTIEFWRSNV